MGKASRRKSAKRRQRVGKLARALVEFRAGFERQATAMGRPDLIERLDGVTLRVKGQDL